MNLAIIGATGLVGGAVMKEALERGHRVTALVRNPGKLAEQPQLTIFKGDVRRIAATASRLQGHDALISAYKTREGADAEALCQANVEGYRAILDAVRMAQLPRLLVVGGAGSLEVAPGQQLVDTPSFPPAVKPYALAVREVLSLLRQDPWLNWSYISPSPLLTPGDKTGSFRVGGDRVLTTGDGPAKINVGDLAVAILDEIETGRHQGKRFTVGY